MFKPSEAQATGNTYSQPLVSPSSHTSSTSSTSSSSQQQSQPPSVAPRVHSLQQQQRAPSEQHIMAQYPQSNGRLSQHYPSNMQLYPSNNNNSANNGRPPSVHLPGGAVIHMRSQPPHPHQQRPPSMQLPSSMTLPAGVQPPRPGQGQGQGQPGSSWRLSQSSSTLQLPQGYNPALSASGHDLTGDQPRARRVIYEVVV